MDIQTEKIELAKRLLDTENRSLIDAVKSVFKSFEVNDEWDDLPEKVIADTEESMRQIEEGKGISHEVAQATYKQWL
jgi:hypothetical protein